MLVFPKKYQYLSAAKKFSLLALFLFTVLFVQAQYETEPDSTTLETIIDDPPPVEDEYQSEPKEDPARYYFLEKWRKGAGLDSFRLRQLPDTAIESLKRDAAFWYADSVFKTQKRQEQIQGARGQQGSNNKEQQQPSSPPPKRSRSFSSQSWFQTILWIVIAGGFAAFMIIYLANSNVRLFRSKNKLIEDNGEEAETEDIFAINYQKEIDKAAANGNYRYAIRLMFLRLLKNLAERNIIQYKQDRTNLDYLMQLSSTRYYHDFFRVTRNYEYSWYGKFAVTNEAYTVIKKDFESFDPGIK